MHSFVPLLAILLFIVARSFRAQSVQEKKGGEAKTEGPTKEEKERIEKTKAAIWKFFETSGAFEKNKMQIAASIKTKMGASERDLKDLRLTLVKDEKTLIIKGNTIVVHDKPDTLLDQMGQAKKAIFYEKGSNFQTTDFLLNIVCKKPKQTGGANIDVVVGTVAVDVATIKPANAWGKVTAKDCEPMLIQLNKALGEKIKGAIVKMPEKDRC